MNQPKSSRFVPFCAVLRSRVDLRRGIDPHLRVTATQLIESSIERVVGVADSATQRVLQALRRRKRRRERKPICSWSRRLPRPTSSASMSSPRRELSDITTSITARFVCATSLTCSSQRAVRTTSVFSVRRTSRKMKRNTRSIRLLVHTIATRPPAGRLNSN